MIWKTSFEGEIVYMRRHSKKRHLPRVISSSYSAAIQKFMYMYVCLFIELIPLYALTYSNATYFWLLAKCYNSVHIFANENLFKRNKKLLYTEFCTKSVELIKDIQISEVTHDGLSLLHYLHFLSQHNCEVVLKIYRQPYTIPSYIHKSCKYNQ